MQPAGTELRRETIHPCQTEGERLAIWALRRVIAGSRCCRPAAPEPAMLDLGAMAAVFRDVFNPADVGMPESLALTKSERRLLHAVAAAQAEDAEMLDNYLYKLALDRPMRARLAEAVTTLAACLALQGYWLARPVAIPAAALTVARAHGWDMEALRVDWPGRG